jgi:hypothetical protein
LSCLAAIYIVARIGAADLYFVAIATMGADPRGAAGYFLFGNAIGALGVLGGMLHLAVAAVPGVVEDNAG